LTLPDGGWHCDSRTENWLAISSSAFEIQMSTLGRGPFCDFAKDATCGRMPFFANDMLDLDLWSASGEPKEIFGFTEYKRNGARLWIAIKYEGMETQPLNPDAKAELLQLLDSLHETGTADSPHQEPALVTQGPSRVRTGPGLNYADYYFLSGGTRLPILGRNPDSTWWAVPGPGDGPGPYGWISATIVTVEGDTNDLPVLPDTPTPLTPWPEPGLPVLGNAAAPPVNSCIAYQDGRVLDQDLPYVRSGPGEQFGVMGQLGRNRWAEVIRADDGWYEIQIGLSKTGWVQASGVGLGGPCATPKPDAPIIINPGAPPADTCVASHPGDGTDTIKVFLGPGEQFAVIARLGNWAEVLDSTSHWHQIRVAPGETGWVNEAQISLEGPCPAPEPAPERIQFESGASSTTLQGTLDGEIQDQYLLWAAAGQTMAVTVTSPNTSVLFHIEGVQDGEVYKHLLDGELSWQGILPLSQDYLVTLDAVGGETSYTLDVSIVTAPTPEPSAVRVQFPPGATSVTLEGMLEPPSRDFYEFSALAGQRATIEIVSEFNRANLGLSGLGDGQPYKRVENEERVWSAVLPQTQDYLLTVAAPADAPTTGYRLFLTIEPLD
jgi:uncharacterized protein YgiM (DUF1202 family)